MGTRAFELQKTQTNLNSFLHIQICYVKIVNNVLHLGFIHDIRELYKLNTLLLLCFMSFSLSLDILLNFLGFPQMNESWFESMVNDGVCIWWQNFCFGDKMTLSTHANSYSWPDPLHSKSSHLYILFEFHLSRSAQVLHLFWQKATSVCLTHF